MPKPFCIQVFGKPGCDKCKVLNQRLDKELKKEKWQQFDKESCSVMTEDGLVAFSEAECINPQRIPAMLVTAWDETKKRYVPVPNPKPGTVDKVCKKSRLYHLLGLQTDYGSVGRGLITPKMIETILQQAVA